MGGRREILIIILFSIAITAFFQYPALLDSHTINDDVRVESFIFFKALDKQLFENNLQVEWAFERNPLGYNAAYYIGTQLFRNPIIFGKILTFILAAILGIFCFKLGSLTNKKIGYALFFLFSIQIWAFPSLSGGMSRAFSYPLIVAFLYYLIKKQTIGISIILLLQLLLYPIALIISLPVLASSQINKKNINKLKKRKLSKNLKIYLGIIVILVISSFFLYGMPKQNTTLVDKQTISRDAVYTEHGRIAIYPPTSIFTLLIKYSPVILFTSLALLAISLLTKTKLNLNKETALLALSGITLYWFSVLFIPKLYYPDRYIRYTIPLVLSIFTVTQTYALIKRIKIKKKKQPLIYFLIIAAICLLVIPTTTRDLIKCNDIELYNKLEQEPKNTLIAGHPRDTSCIPVFAKRNVLVSHESIYPLYKYHYAEMEQRLTNFFNTQFSSDVKEIKSFCLKYNITYILINKERYGSKKYYLAPFDAQIEDLTKDNTDFFLLDNPKNIPINENMTLFPCSILK